tara:strand:- start:818 stop:1321 length:504 start_codon:yes stop_codon:yes gene_type:complete
MSFFNEIKKMTIIQRKQESLLFEYVMDEIEKGIRNKGLWGKALVKCEGNEVKASADYINLRVQELKDEIKLNNIFQDERLQAIQAMAIENEVLSKKRKKEVEIKTKEKELEIKTKEKEDSISNITIELFKSYSIELFKSDSKEHNDASIKSLAKSRIAERMRKLEDK